MGLELNDVIQEALDALEPSLLQQEQFNELTQAFNDLPKRPLTKNAENNVEVIKITVIHDSRARAFICFALQIYAAAAKAKRLNELADGMEFLRSRFN